ncbi:MAG: hypothetical protein QXX12_04790 [Nanopusillaceae archaeon]
MNEFDKIAKTPLKICPYFLEKGQKLRGGLNEFDKIAKTPLKICPYFLEKGQKLRGV